MSAEARHVVERSACSLSLVPAMQTWFSGTAVVPRLRTESEPPRSALGAPTMLRRRSTSPG